MLFLFQICLENIFCKTKYLQITNECNYMIKELLHFIIYDRLLNTWFLPFPPKTFLILHAICATKIRCHMLIITTLMPYILMHKTTFRRTCFGGLFEAAFVLPTSQEWNLNGIMKVLKGLMFRMSRLERAVWSNVDQYFKERTSISNKPAGQILHSCFYENTEPPTDQDLPSKELYLLVPFMTLFQYLIK